MGQNVTNLSYLLEEYPLKIIGLPKLFEGIFSKKEQKGDFFMQKACFKQPFQNS